MFFWLFEVVLGVSVFILIFVGMFNILLLFELISNVGEEDEVEKKEIFIVGSEDVCGGKRKKLWVFIVGGEGGVVREMEFKKLELK